jgi:hypothetical protein
VPKSGNVASSMGKAAALGIVNHSMEAGAAHATRQHLLQLGQRQEAIAVVNA